jgi:glucose/arabinose dehydrogenase
MKELRLSSGVLISLTFLVLLTGAAMSPGVIKTAEHDLRYTEITSDLEHPWGFAFLPDGRMLLTERPGRLRIISNGRLNPQPVSGLPEIAASGQGGLLDVALHPNFTKNNLVYLSYSAADQGKAGTEVLRGKLQDHQLLNVETIFRMQPKSKGSRHFGSRLVFDRDGYLFITLGDRGDRPRAQKPDDHAGSVIRLHDDGRIPSDNPFVGKHGWKAEKYTLGHRNMQGAAIHPETGLLWTQEHGPQGGDEVNVIRPGVNYGWPVITYGVNYGFGTKIGEGTHKTGMAQPVYHWVPSIAPSGMAFYNGSKFPKWNGNLFIGALKDQMLARLVLDGEKIVHEERLLKNMFGRIRDVRQGPDGYLYLLTDENNGMLIRIEPAN